MRQLEVERILVEDYFNTPEYFSVVPFTGSSPQWPTFRLRS
jgi:hypothetical protein